FLLIMLIMILLVLQHILTSPNPPKQPPIVAQVRLRAVYDVVDDCGNTVELVGCCCGN
ncbi:unnamed protein product, partial [Rotaria sp. Silwood1]